MASGPASGDDRVIASRPTVCAMITATTRSAAAGRQQARVPRHADQNQGHADVEQPQAQVCRPLQPGPRAAVPARRSGSASAPRSWPRRAPAGAGPATPVPAPAGVRRPPPLPPAGTRPPAPQPSYAGRSGAADDLGAHGDDVPRPVSTSTANAGQATWLKRRAAARGISAPRRRSAGTRAASVSCPPTQMVAARTCRNSRIVSQLTDSITLLRAEAGHHGPETGRSLLRPRFCSISVSAASVR
jgi:hypothetical protein